MSQQMQGQPAIARQMGDHEYEDPCQENVVIPFSKAHSKAHLDVVDKTKVFQDLIDHSKKPIVFIADSHAEIFGKDAETYYTCFKDVALAFESEEGRQAFYKASSDREWYIAQFDIGIMNGVTEDDSEKVEAKKSEQYDFGVILGNLKDHSRPFFDDYQNDGGTIYKCVPNEKHDFDMGKLASYINMCPDTRKRPHIPNRFTV